MKTLETQVVVVGSGPGGATVARELALNNKDVIILERGADHQFYGNFIGTALMAEKMGFCWSKEGLNMIRALTTGGSSMIYCGAAVPAPPWLEKKYGIDLSPFMEEAKAQIGIAPLPDTHIGPGARLLMETAQNEGIDWKPMERFINAKKCDASCPVCMYGCKKGAKWSARHFVYEAVSHGARLINNARVEKVICENGRAWGVKAKSGRREFLVKADIVVLSAGGLGTPVILLRSGIQNAGQELFADPLAIVHAPLKGAKRGVKAEIPMCCGKIDNSDDGIIIGDLADPLPSYLLQTIYKGPKEYPKALHYPKMLGVMIKIKDDLAGRIFDDETFSKPLTQNDRAKIALGIGTARKILEKSGCDMDKAFQTPVRAAHPGGTAGIGKVVDNDLETKIKNLFVCDASVFPEPCGLPPVWTLVGFGKRLAKTRLISQV
jgi:choline dehydrogenase-like flavoprotein